jgi:hypothetical protein
MAQHRIEAVGVVLDGGGEREASQLRQTRTANGWPELEMAELLEARPGRHPLVLLDGEVPCLGRTCQVIRRQPRPVRGEGTLTAEELLTLVDPVQGVDRAVVRRELQLVEARDGLALVEFQRRLPVGRLRDVGGGGGDRRDDGPIDPTVKLWIGCEGKVIGGLEPDLWKIRAVVLQ